jgi:hypothetical protein
MQLPSASTRTGMRTLPEPMLWLQLLAAQQVAWRVGGL